MAKRLLSRQSLPRYALKIQNLEINIAFAAKNVYHVTYRHKTRVFYISDHDLIVNMKGTAVGVGGAFWLLLQKEYYDLYKIYLRVQMSAHTYSINPFNFNTQPSLSHSTKTKETEQISSMFASY